MARTTRTRYLSAILGGFMLLFFQISCNKEEVLTLQEEMPEAELRGGKIQGQSIQYNIEGVEPVYVLNGEEEWSFDINTIEKSVAIFGAYFEFAPLLSPFLTQAQIDTAVFEAFEANKCNFWHGRPLERYFKPYGTRGVPILPRSTGNVEPQTNWILTNANYTNQIDVTLSNMFVSSATYEEKAKKNGSWSSRFDFNLGKTSPLEISLLYRGSVLMSKVINPNSISKQSDNDWLYASTGEFFGSSEASAALAFANNMMVNEIQGTNQFDDYKSNDNKGGTRGIIPNQTFPNLTLGGDYQLQVKGKVDGNLFEKTQLFTISKNVTITGGCN